MPLLHIVNKSPFTYSVIQSCLDHCTHHDSVIFIEDGVLNALNSSPFAEQIAKIKISGTNFYALTEDIVARGIENQLSSTVIQVDYQGFVRLSVENSPIQSWY